jgi:hypothetical protein
LPETDDIRVVDASKSIGLRIKEFALELKAFNNLLNFLLDQETFILKSHANWPERGFIQLNWFHLLPQSRQVSLDQFKLALFREYAGPR